MAPVLKVVEAGVGEPVLPSIPVHLTVVEQVGNDGLDVAGRYSCGDVLTVAAASAGTEVVSIDSCL